jgi:tetratricopeptide (TPR) repeat protein
MAKQCSFCQSSYEETLENCPACAPAAPARRGDDSPLTASLVVERPSRIAIEESEVGSVAAAGPAPLAESEAASTPSSHSEFDLFLLRLESFEAEQAPASLKEVQPLAARDLPGNFGVHLLESHGLEETNLEIDLDGLVGSDPSAGNGEAGSSMEEPQSEAHMQAASARVESWADHPLESGSELRPLQNNGDKKMAEGWPLSPETKVDSVLRATPWTAPGGCVQPIHASAGPARSDYSWLKGTFFGFVLGVGVLLGLTAAGVRLPSASWVLREQPKASPRSASINQPDASDPPEIVGSRQDQRLTKLASTVQSLQSENKELHSAMEQFRVLLKAEPIEAGHLSLEKDLRKLLLAKEEAAQRVGDLDSALGGARTAIATLGQKVSALQENLDHNEQKLAATEKQLQETRRAQKAASEVQRKAVIQTQSKPVAQDHTVLKVPEAPPAHDPLAAYNAYAQGLELFHHGKHSAAQKSFSAAARLDDQDARYFYMLGLCRWELGQRDQATADFKQAAVLEQAGKPSGVFVRPVFEDMPAAAQEQIENLRGR